VVENVAQNADAEHVNAVSVQNVDANLANAKNNNAIDRTCDLASNQLALFFYPPSPKATARFQRTRLVI